jgi:exocyst complex component 2
VDENPIWHWLNSRSLYLKDRIARSFERIRIEIEIQRRQLANNPNTNAKSLAKYLRSAADMSTARILRDSSRDIDAPNVIAFWEKVHASITALLSVSDGVLGELVEFWETAQSFIGNKAQMAFSPEIKKAGQEHLELEPDDVANLRSGAQELVNLFRDSTFAFFSDPPVDDLSDLYSPIPPTPITPASAGTPSASRNFNFDPANVPAPSIKRGDTWEKYAFWPPGGNSLSGAHYLGRIIVLVGTAASELVNLSVVNTMRSGSESLKTLVGAVRERSVAAVCAAWTPDAERCKYMELWQRHPDRRDLTTMPGLFIAFEEKVLSGMQKIAYISEAVSVGGRGEDVLVPPSAKLLQTIRTGFVTSLYKALSGMVENAEGRGIDEVVDNDPDGITLPLGAEERGDGEVVLVDARNFVSHRIRASLKILLLTRFPERPPPDHPLELGPPPLRDHPSANLPIRILILRQTHRRKQDHPRRPLPNRCPSLPILRQTHRRLPANHNHSRHHLKTMGTRLRPPHRRPALHLRRAALARPRPQRS